MLTEHDREQKVCLVGRGSPHHRHSALRTRHAICGVLGLRSLRVIAA